MGARAELFTGPRLLRLGESLELHCRLPAGTEAAGEMEVYARYLEQGDPGAAFAAGGGLGWLDAQQPECLPLRFEGGRATLRYTPRRAGSYLARWRAGGEVFCRYFSAVEDDWVVLRLSTFDDLEPEPTLHATGIPLDYRLPVDRFRAGDAQGARLLSYHRHFGDGFVPQLPDTPDLEAPERLRVYREAMACVRALIPDPQEARSARIELRHDLDPGYPLVLEQLGIVDHWGLQEANARPWLGMPEFPYFAAPEDSRKVHQGSGGLVAHQWDFCGGWHFLGPVGWHYKAAAGEWDRAEECLRQGAAELANAARLSGHPVFAVPLYDGLVGPGYPSPLFEYEPEGTSSSHPQALGMPAFVERYQRFMAFVLPCSHKVAYARSIDMADYFRRHYRVTPRTVFVSRTEHVLYDLWWLCSWCNHRVLVPRQRIPWETRPSTVFRLRDTVYPYKDPLSSEYLLVEDQRRSVRFERESPNPVWWFDYAPAGGAGKERGPRGSDITYTRTPDVVVRGGSWTRQADGWSTVLRMDTQEVFPDYAVCLWALPAAPVQVETDAREHVLACNTQGEWHLVLYFDLCPGAQVHVRLR